MSAGLAIAVAAAAACTAFAVFGAGFGLEWVYRYACWVNDYEYLGREGVVMQRSKLDCGAACLEMLLQRQRIPHAPADLAEVRLLRGTSMLNLQQALRTLGIPAAGIRPGSVNALTALVTSGHQAIVSLDRGYIAPQRAGRARLADPFGQLRHWAVVDGGDARTVTLSDPAVGRIRLRLEAFAAHWAGTALLSTLRLEAEHRPGRGAAEGA